ncbi:MAG: helix-hairpin-helix domain-containing protein [Rikenellaceae bacterium]
MKIGFSGRESRGVVVLIIVILSITVISTLYRFIERKRAREAMIEMTAIIESDSLELFNFDPNTADLRQLMRLGLKKSEAVSIIRYREYGKVFRIKEDLFTCYGISDSVYYALEPYIVIADTFRLKRRDEYVSSYNNNSYASHSAKREYMPLSQFMVDTVGGSYLVAVGALTPRQAEVFVRWRDLSGIYNMDELRECYVVSDSIASMLEPYAIFTPEQDSSAEDGLIDINRADSAELRKIYGVGEKSVEAILNYRDLLGGFYSAEQLSELKVITESNFEKIIQQISCDSCDISKIDVNFASAKTMSRHPYIAPKVLRRLLKIRELKGGWSTIEEMKEDNIFTTEEATRVRPYLLFSEFEPRRVDDDKF